MQVPLILRQFQDATDTAEDAPRPQEKPPKPVEQLKSGSFGLHTAHSEAWHVCYITFQVSSVLR